MVRTITAVQAFQPFSDYLRQPKPAPQAYPLQVFKATLAPLPASSHVIISEEGRRRLAAEQLKVGSWDWDM